MEIAKLFATESELKDFALITHVVPARRLRRALPKGIEPETFKDPETGEELGFISVGCWKNHHFRSAALKAPRLNFPQISFRTYTQFKGREGVYFFGTDLGTWSSLALQKFSSPIVEKGDIEILVNRDNSGNYEIYECSCASDHGKFEAGLRARGRPAPKEPFATGADKSLFLTHRLHGLMKTPYGALGDQMVSHKVMEPLEGELLDFKCDFWVKLGLLKAQEAQSRFYSVLVTPSVKFTFYPPVPAQLIPFAS